MALGVRTVDMRNWAASSFDDLKNSGTTVVGASWFLIKNLFCAADESLKAESKGKKIASLIWDDEGIKTLAQARLKDLLLDMNDGNVSVGIYQQLAQLELFDYIFGFNKESPIPDYLKYSFKGQDGKEIVKKSGENMIQHMRSLNPLEEEINSLGAFYQAKIPPMEESVQDKEARELVLKGLELRIDAHNRLEHMARELCRHKKFQDFVHQKLPIDM